MASLTTFLIIKMLSFNVTPLVIASNYHRSCLMMATTAGGATNNHDSTPLLPVPLRLMITIKPIVFFCHNIYLHHLRPLINAAAFSSKVISAIVEWIDRPDVNTGDPLMTNFAFNGFLRDDPCTCSDERRYLLLDNCCLLLPHMFPFKLQRDPKTISE